MGLLCVPACPSPADTSERMRRSSSAKRFALSPFPKIRGNSPCSRCSRVNALAARKMLVGSRRWRSSGAMFLQASGDQESYQEEFSIAVVQFHRQKIWLEGMEVQGPFGGGHISEHPCALQNLFGHQGPPRHPEDGEIMFRGGSLLQTLDLCCRKPLSPCSSFHVGAVGKAIAGARDLKQARIFYDSAARCLHATACACWAFSPATMKMTFCWDESTLSFSR